ncbi:sla2 Src-like adaptor 2 [Pleurotus ostreatus]|nr:sla2 Src-like adaptor 2 [Pleurotus ostreatus]
MVITEVPAASTALISCSLPGTSKQLLKYGDETHHLIGPLDKDKEDYELGINIKKAIKPEETAPKQVYVRSKIRRYHSGVDCGYNLYWQTKYRHSKLWLRFTKCCKRDTQL